jgi:hypothetical protein
LIVWVDTVKVVPAGGFGGGGGVGVVEDFLQPITRKKRITNKGTEMLQAMLLFFTRLIT